MLIGVDRERRVPMPQPLRHNLDRYPGFEQQRPVSVADIVRTDVGNPGAGDDPFEGLGNGVGVDRLPSTSANTQPVGSIPTAPRSDA